MKYPLTDQFVAAARAGTVRRGRYRDETQPHLLLDVRTKRCSWLISRKVAGRQYTRRLCPAHTATVAEARAMARAQADALVRAHKTGAEGNEGCAQSREPVLRDLIDAWIDAGCPDGRGRVTAPGTIRYYRTLARRVIPDKMARNAVKYLDRQDIARIHTPQRGTPVQANRVRTLLIRLLTYADRRGWRDSPNVARDLPTYPEKARSAEPADNE